MPRRAGGGGRHRHRDAQGQARVRHRGDGQEGHRLLMSGDDQALVEVSGSGVAPELALQPDGRGVLVWRFATPVRAIATTVLGGGIGEREWAVNAEVGLGYAEAAPAAHVASIASAIAPALAGRSNRKTDGEEKR